MKRVSIMISALLLAACLHPFKAVGQTEASPAGAKYAERLRRFEEFVRQQMEHDKIPGLTIGFRTEDYTWLKGFGYADLENRVPATERSAYRLASITKAFTGVAILQLVEQGKMKLDDEIQDYVPGYPKQQWPVTVRQLLFHIGGGQQGAGLGPTYVSPKDVVARIAQHPLRFEPGMRFEYTTSGYNLLGAAIEEVTGMPLGEYFRRYQWQPLGMKDTLMDSVRDLIPHRVQGYEVVRGEVKNIPYIDVSSRFGGGGATGTVPDLLRWARILESRNLLSKQSVELILTPVAARNGRYAGFDDASSYYTFGWMLSPRNGQGVIEAGGRQLGTSTNLIYIPSRNMTLAFACNVQLPGVRTDYLAELYELLTGEPYDLRIFVPQKEDRSIINALFYVFDYGALHFEHTRQPFTSESHQLAEAFAYFNRSVSRESLAANHQAAAKAIEDGRHPVTGDPFIKVGSYIALKLSMKYGVNWQRRYSTTGAIPFFADYIALYTADEQHPKGFRFDESFERMIAQWNRDWTRTWSTEIRLLRFAADTDFDAVGRRLREAFAGAKVRPGFIDSLLDIQDSTASLKAAKLAVDLYPDSERTNGNWGLVLLLMSQTSEKRARFKQHIGELESPLRFFQRALALQPDGFASAQVLGQIGRNWLQAGRGDDARALLELAIELHPREAMVYTELGKTYLKLGLKDKANEAVRKALALDPQYGPALDLLKELAK